MQVTCGIDWAEDHHDIALVAADGAVIAQRRIGNDAVGFAELLAMLAEHDTPDGHDEDEGGGELVCFARSPGCVRCRYAAEPRRPRGLLPPTVRPCRHARQHA